MQATFFRYFFFYLIQAKTRQKLLFIAFLGLMLSSFSLLSIQGIMGGLQENLTLRSKEYYGLGHFKIQSSQEVTELLSKLKSYPVQYSIEWEVELLAKFRDYLQPVVLHGYDPRYPPPFLKDKEKEGVILGVDLAHKLKAHYQDQIQFFSPATTQSLLGEVPRFSSLEMSDMLLSEIGPIDQFHAWVRLSFLQNLRRERGVNKLRIYSRQDFKLPPTLSNDPRYQSWESEHKTLVWSLDLETRVMFLLFFSMSFLIAIAITTGLLLFFSKIKNDLASFWILGAEQGRLMRMTFQFVTLLSLLGATIGSVAGIIFLKVLEHNGHEMMPDIFVERNLPVDLSWSSVTLSLLLPFSVAMLFTYQSFRYFKRENLSFLSLLRKA